jgi:hypothetical protein
MALNAGKLFENAMDAYHRIEAEDKYPGQPDALVAILFAAISLEAFINELAYCSVPDDGDTVIALRNVLNEAEASRAPTRAKYHLAKLVLSQKGFDRGAAPFQNFDTLMRLRDLIVHAHVQPGVIEDEKGQILNADPPAAVKTLQAARVISTISEICTLLEIPADSLVNANWLDVVSTKAVARWACNAAAAMVIAILDALPAGQFAEIMNRIYRRSFLRQAS